VDDTTILDRSPPAQPFVTGMNFSSSIDAITGEFVASPLKPSSIKVHPSFSPTRGEIFSVNYYSDVRELSNSRELGFKASITAPVEGIAVSANHGIDFSSSNVQSASTLLIILYWELSGEVVLMDLNAVELSDDAKTALTSDSSTWRNKYGDYFVYGYGGSKRFSAVWLVSAAISLGYTDATDRKCTSNSSASSRAFKDSISVSAQGPGDIGGSAGLQSAIIKSANATQTTLEVQYSLIGGTENVTLDTDDVAATFQSFRNNAVSNPAYALLRHYSIINPDIPHEIKISYSTYVSLISAFSKARYALLANGVAPGTQSTRAQRQQYIYDIYNEINNARMQKAHVDATAAKLQPILDTLSTLLTRQDLVMDLRSLTFNDLCK
jgi:hypothetical protein